MILVKSAPKKKVFAKQLFCQLKICQKKIGLLGKTFLGCTFYYGHVYSFEISTKRRDFFIPHST